MQSSFKDVLEISWQNILGQSLIGSTPKRSTSSTNPCSSLPVAVNAHTADRQLAEMPANGFYNLRGRQPLRTEVEFLSNSLPGQFIVLV
jgi:hypothetical protein